MTGWTLLIALAINGACVDTSSDSANCGGCGKTCKPGKICQAGKCR